jgi:membrane protein implicated in regulation of membrane protease activity
MATIDKVFGACLIGGFGFAVVMLLSAGAASRLRFPRLRMGRLRLPRMRLPRPRVAARLRPPRLPRVRTPRVVATAGTAAAKARLPRPASPPGPVVDAALIPPGTLPIMLGLFATLFGGTGLFCRSNLQLDAFASLWFATGGAAAGTVVAVFALWQYFIAGAAASEVRGESPLGKIGHVAIPIPEDGVGSVAYMTEGKRISIPARARNGHALDRQAAIMIVDMLGHTAVVEELPDGL